MGPLLEEAKKKKKKKETEEREARDVEEFVDLIKRLEDLSNDKNFDSRVSYLIINLLDKRSNGWKDLHKNEGPMTVKELHKQHRQEQQEKAAAVYEDYYDYGYEEDYYEPYDTY